MANAAAERSPGKIGAKDRPRSPWSEGVRRFRANRQAVGGLVVLVLLCLLCLLGLPYALAFPGGTAAGAAGEQHARRYDTGDTGRSSSKGPDFAGPEWFSGNFSWGHPLGGREAEAEPGKPPAFRETHLLGSDSLGRDYLARVLYGGCVSLLIGLASAFAACVVGVLYGMIAGYVGGRIDNLMMRVVEILFSLPYMLLVVLTFHVLLGAGGGGADADGKETGQGPLAALIPDAGLRSIVAMVIAVGAFNWMTEARIVRGQVLALREMPYIEAARAIGVPAWRILLVHMLPNLLGPIIVVATLMVPQAILLESFLSFLGIGIQAPQVTWGILAADSVKTINTVQNQYWILIPPCAALALTLLALNFVGDGLRDAFDPQSRE